MSTPDSGSSRAPRWFWVLGIALVAFNLRPALAGVGPLVAEIQAGTGLSSPTVGLLTTIPLLAFGTLSLAASAVSRRLGLEGAIGLGLVLIAVGTGLRGGSPVWMLYAGTAVLGVGVALGNVLLPALAKRRFPRSPGPITSLYSSMMGVGASLAAGFSVPLAAMLTWRGSLAVWAVPSVIALAVWFVLTRGAGTPRSGSRRGEIGPLFRSPLAWQVAFYMGLQSLTFYVLLAWLPAFLQSQGMSEASAGGLLALSQVTGIMGSAVIPVWAGRTVDQRGIVWTLGVLEALSIGALVLEAPMALTAAVSVLGFVLGGTFALALTLLVICTDRPETAASLSGMAQTVGYLLAAGGPPAMGWVRDATGGWAWVMGSLFLVLALKVAAGIPAGRRGARLGL